MRKRFDHGCAAKRIPMPVEQVVRLQFILHGNITTRGINLGLAKKHRKINALRSQPLINGLQQLLRDSQTTVVCRNADFGDSSNEKISGFRSDDFLVQGGMGNDFPGGAFHQPTMARPPFEIAAGEENGIKGKTGEEQIPKLAVLGVGNGFVASVNDHRCAARRSHRTSNHEPGSAIYNCALRMTCSLRIHVCAKDLLRNRAGPILQASHLFFCEKTVKRPTPHESFPESCFTSHLVNSRWADRRSSLPNPPCMRTWQLFWTIVLGIIGSILGGSHYPHLFAPSQRTIPSRWPYFLRHSAQSLFSTSATD